MRALVYYGSARTGQAEFLYLNKFIDNVIALDPKFHRVYDWAAYAVTYKETHATQEEFRASVRYLEKGIEAFPDDGELYWVLGQRYWLDLIPSSPEQRREYLEKGAQYLETATHKPNAQPRWATQAAEIRSKLGQREHAVRQLREVILTTDNKKARARMLGKLAYLANSVDVANELEKAADDFRAQWKANLPYAPATLHVFLGEAPSPVIDFDDLATERDLVGTNQTNSR
jgi:tetratricopeptide (TPR) repeat protein